MEFSIKDFFSKCDQIRKNGNLVTFLKKSLMEDFISCSMKWIGQSSSISCKIKYLGRKVEIHSFFATINIAKFILSSNFYQCHGVKFTRIHMFIWSVFSDLSNKYKNISANIYLFKANNRNTRKWCEICSVFLLLTLNILYAFF